MGRLFGTDGVRGLANRDVTAELALDLSVSAAHILSEVGSRRTAVVGRDPRASGEFLQAAVTAGLASAGVDVIDVGVLPTPAVAFLTKVRRADLGVMLSASHNAMPDNGIKFFNADGNKLADQIEEQIEARLREDWDRPTGDAVGRIVRDDAADTEYIGHLLSSITTPLDGLTVVVDGANGAASLVGPVTYREAGADVIEIHCRPDGYNINDGCGSTHIEDLQQAVREHGADLGIAHDGDADRCLAVDAEGNLVDGDQLMAIIALSLRDQSRLVKDTVVATVMANLGFKQAMQREGIEVVETAVGDRYVLEAMLESGYILGGEQSGHVVMTEHATTGDGILTALQVMSRMAATGKSLAELAAVMDRLPQVLVNVAGVDKNAVDSNATVARAVADAETRLGDTGRVLLRKSGTEPLVRVMVEAPDEATAESVAAALADVVRAELSL
ncbi:MAG TPA: phosphoglucosamine mutase [Actinomycetota bacterium]|nr:phosphoglucosamine mutase [Actinomycetota bacterium]HNL51557.1 phosphoglucosamine mutase [Actinomycetota bacterium]HUM87580.1 phosphoglucosamine mutase [Actinomycetota bacterium]